MTASAIILAIGDELLLGRTVDTNSSYLARWCSDQGIAVMSCTILPDDESEMTRAIQNAANEADLILITGGLGPTLDDRTRHALGSAMDRPLEHSAQAWKQIAAYYKRVRPGTEVPESNRRQALVPQGARILRNDRGTAPGLLAKVGSAWCVSMPGVPIEMYAMVDRLREKLPKLLPSLKTPTVLELHFAGIGESAAQDILGDLLQGTNRLTVGITAHEIGHITVRLVGAVSTVQRRMAQIRRLLKEWVLPEPGLAPSVVHALRKSSLEITTVESCTCGQVLAQLGSVSGASAVLKEGAVAYHNDVKIKNFGVSPGLIKRYGVVSEHCVEAMALGALERTGAHVACATSGIAGPEGGTKAKPVGTVWIAVASAEGMSTRLLSLRGDRGRIQRRAAMSVLLLTWQHIHRYAQKRG